MGLPIYILDKDAAVGRWLLDHLKEIDITAHWVPTAADLLAEAEMRAPVLCLVALRPPVGQALTLLASLTQEPRFAPTSFILMGPTQYKHAAFEAGADDYLTTPPDVIELRKRVRLYLDRAELKARLRAEPLSDPASTAPVQDTPLALPDAASARIDRLQEECSLLKQVLEHAGEAVALVSLNGTIQYANPVWCQLMNYTPASSIGAAMEWPPRVENPAVAQKLAAALHHRTPWHGELQYTGPDNRILDVSATITPVFDATRALIGHVIIQRDIGPRRALDALKAQFLADAAFQMRTPVTNVKMRQYLLRQAPPDQHETHLAALDREIERLSLMIDAMLELARMDAGLIQMQPESTDLNRLAADAVVRYGPAAQERGIALNMTRLETLPAVVVDPVYIARVLGILIDNAFQHMAEGGRLDLRLGQEFWTGGSFATLSVQDTGTGIDPDDQEHIFERFFRSQSTRDSGVRGGGLGLALAREIMNRHDGDIIVESVVGQGSTFTLWLPIHTLDGQG
ncbi:MAG: PAS domain-containing protein [Anaerolineae bacterium]|nr:PAS domain-containing protein [Anaerolineae bacterium]